MQNFNELGLNKENEKWLDLLVGNEEDEKTFKDASKGFHNEQSPMFGILTFRNYLLSKQEGRGQNVTTQCLSKEVRCKEDRTRLTEKLSEMFLDLITDTEVDRYIDSAITADELIQLHNNRIALRLVCIIDGYETLLLQDKREALRSIQS